jgi:hypothetical protein
MADAPRVDVPADAPTGAVACLPRCTSLSSAAWSRGILAARVARLPA